MTAATTPETNNPILHTKKWIFLSLCSLLVVASLGVLMRYKIGFEFPYFNQKNLQYAHSHFAFAGWVSQTLMVFMIAALRAPRIASYERLLWANLIVAAGMLITFSIQGYGGFSITFSTLSILLTFYFSYQYYTDLKNEETILQKQWFYAAMLFNVLSTAGTAALVYMMVTKHIPQHSYLASIYWYLHFQFNGWFFFGSMGLFIYYLTAKLKVAPPTAKIFWLFGGSCIPAYGLSVLWANIPLWTYIMVVAASMLQFAGWILLLQHLNTQRFFKLAKVNSIARLLLLSVAVALTIKLSLQLASVIPAVSQLAFGFRPIVIAYLHLVLLAIITLFLLSYAYLQGLLVQSSQTNNALLIFTAGIFINEGILAVQGIASFSYTVIPYTNLLLLLVSIVLFTGAALLLIAQRKAPKN